MISSYSDRFITKLREQSIWTKDELMELLRLEFPELTDATLTWRIHDLKTKGLVYSGGRGKYVIDPPTTFQPTLPSASVRLVNRLRAELPGTDICLSETSWLNGLLPGDASPPSYTFTLIELDRGQLNQAFELLLEFSKKILLNPNETLVKNLVQLETPAVILRALAKESPTIEQNGYTISSLEKLLLDALVHTDIFGPYQPYLRSMVEKAYDEFNLNIDRVRRYARRRDRLEELDTFLYSLPGVTLPSIKSESSAPLTIKPLTDHALTTELATGAPTTALAAPGLDSSGDEPDTDAPASEGTGPDGLICVLTGRIVKVTDKENTLQSLIRQLNEEYGFDMSDLERDFTFMGEDESGRKIRRKAELVVFELGASHTQDEIIRVCFVQDGKTKESDKSKGAVLLDDALNMLETCEFGLWTNGLTNSFRHRTGFKPTGEARLQEVSDFPGAGESMDDLTRSDRMTARKPANDSLIRTFKRCHDYIYGNQGRTKDAFWQLLYLIFCKIYDEKRRDVCHRKGESYRRRFWVGATEPHTEDGRRDVSERIKNLFEELKDSEDFQDVFEGNEQIQLNQKALSYVAGELAKYSFLDATVDVKGMAYETIVSNTLKQERGQFFTPRNIVRLMVDMMDPDPSHRVLDPACGSGGFLVMVLDYVRKKIATELHPDLTGEWLRDTFNSPDVNERVRDYAAEKLFGIDFDPDLKRAARMNMVMAGDGHANIFQFNSLEYPDGDDTDEIDGFNKRLLHSLADDVVNDMEPEYQFEDANGKFDLIFSNPPFGAKIPINDPATLSKYDLGHVWKRVNGTWDMDGRLSASEPPEILFIDRCYQFLKPGGRLAIVLPDGILGNPNTEYVRDWLLKRFRVLASVDLPVEAFLPQVGVQASLLFLRKLTDTERALQRDGQMKPYDVFMAIAEKVGKDRRGNPIQERDEDGQDVISEKTITYLQTDPRTGEKVLKQRREKTPNLDDDLPKIGEAYHRFRNGERL